MKKAAAIAVCLAVLVLAGCHYYSPPSDRALKKRYAADDYPANPIPGLKQVAIVTLDASVTDHADLLAFTTALHTQLQSIEGLEVAPDRAALDTMDAYGLVLPRDGLKLADTMHVDGLFVAIVTDYNPYGQPAASVGLVLFSRATAPVRRADIDRIVQGGRPLALPTSETSKPVTAVFGVFDASQATTRKHIEWFAAGQSVGEAGLGWERYYRSMPLFMRFVSYEMVWKMFDQLQVERSMQNRGG